MRTAFSLSGNAMTDQDTIPLEVRVLSDIYRMNDGRPGQMPVSPYEIARKLRMKDEDILDAMRLLKVDGYLSRQSDANPVGSYADRNSYFDLTEEGADHMEQLSRDYAASTGEQAILDMLDQNGAMTWGGIRRALSKDASVDDDELDVMLDTLSVYLLVDKEGDLLDGYVYKLH